MKVFSILAIISLGAALSAMAQEAQTVTLQQAIDIALQNNISMIQTQTTVDAASSRVTAAYGTYLPTLSASAGWNRTQVDQQAGTRIVGGQVQTYDAIFNVQNNWSSGLNLSYTIFDGFNREAGFNGAKSSALSSEDKLLRTRQTVTNLVENAYLNVLRQEQLVKVSDENLKRDNRQLERIMESNKVGAVALADVYRQQTQVAADELALIQAQNNYEKAKADIVSLIGLDIVKQYTFADPAIAPAIAPEELDSTRQRYAQPLTWLDRAVSARPDFIAAKEDLSAAESGVTQARSGYWPTISASAGFNLTNTELQTLADNKNLTWGVNLRWNLFDAFRTNENLQTAVAAKTSAEVALAQAKRDIGVQLKKALLDLDAAQKQVEVSQKGLRSATEDRKIAEERYNLGAGTLLDLLTANAGLVNAQANDINATYNYIIVKRNLEYVIGERAY